MNKYFQNEKNFILKNDCTKTSNVSADKKTCDIKHLNEKEIEEQALIAKKWGEINKL